MVMFTCDGDYKGSCIMNIDYCSITFTDVDSKCDLKTRLEASSGTDQYTTA